MRLACRRGRELLATVELTWTETPACHAVLAATAVLREDAPYVSEQAEDWLGSVRLSKIPDTFAQRLVAAFKLGGSEDWAVQALTTLATEATDADLSGNTAAPVSSLVSRGFNPSGKRRDDPQCLAVGRHHPAR